MAMRTISTTDRLCIIDISDIHFGHRRTPSKQTLCAIRRYLPDSEQMRDVDIIFVSGDFTDRLLSMPEFDVYCAQAAIIHILQICKKYDILLRVLEGTKSHDRKQSIHFEYLNELTGINADLKYHQTLCIEYIPRFGINVLYLPDEWHTHASQTLEDARRLIASHGLDWVHLVIMHGAFTVQLPGLPSPALHDPVAWSEIAKWHVISGHVHHAARFLNIIIPGSFNRTGHDEEEAKGYVKITYYRNKDFKYEFIENKLAKIYKTINIYDKEISDLITELTEYNFPDYSAIRLEHLQTDPVKAIKETLEEAFPTLIFSTILRGKKKQESSGMNFVQRKFIPTPINESNLARLIKERLAAKGESDDTLLRVEELINKER